MEAQLEARLKEMVAALQEVERQLAEPELIADQSRYPQVARRHSELQPVVEAFDDYRMAEREGREAEELAGAEADPEMAEYFREVAREKHSQLERLEEVLKRMLVPQDPNDQKDVIMEVRAAAGGDEAALWAADLFRMYERYAERQGWRVEPLESSSSGPGGFKEVTFSVKGNGAYSRFKHEAGSHRVQRVPKTESSGRIHTSVATVAVLPEVEEVEVDLSPDDLEVDVFRSSGPGGQSVNTTDSAVRITHLPTGTVVSCQDEKSQLQNKEKAMRILRARLYRRQMDEQLGEIAESRRSQVGSGERAEKIRTYNFRENRVTDHRVNLTLKRLHEILEGDLDEFVEALMAQEEARRLAG
ncbi:MAG: peptide chain release factor 1 [Actinomycetota bacterium]|nr:peptide chain release factor 1 [Actinomycetota bacterium]